MQVGRMGSDSGGRGISQRRGAAVIAVAGLLFGTPAFAIDVNLTMEDAKQALAAGRDPMVQAYAEKGEDEQRRRIAEALNKATEGYIAVADQERHPCARVMFGTKRFTLEEFGRKEARESVKQNQDVRMPEKFIQKVIDMPIMEIQVHLCGNEEYFAEGAEVVLQQSSQNIPPIDVSPAERGRKNEGKGPAYRSRFTARFSYDSFDPNAMTKVVVFFPDGTLITIPADLSKIQ